MDYRREIDGLRALAVVPVILFHAGFEAFSGGFVGVDIFFVISGYLITTIILAELEQGKFSIINFYERRARRILPALFLVMAVCVLYAWFWLFPSDMKEFSQSLVAVALFASNFLFWIKSGYFDSVAELKPLLHTWSLAVEEQYYVFFPLFLMLFWRLGKRWLLVVLAVTGAVSLGLAQWAAVAEPTAAFFLLPTRGWELLIGAFAAFYLSKTNRIHFSSGVIEVAAGLGLTLILYSIFAYSKATPFPGLYALVPTVGTLLIILFATRQTVVGRFIGNKVFVGIGLISYSAYLWHQPLFAFSRLRSVDEPSGVEFAILSVIALTLAYFSWKFVEMPFRKKGVFSRKKVFTLAIAGSIVFTSLGFLGHIYNGLPKLRFSEDQLAAINSASSSPKRAECHFPKEENSLSKAACRYFSNNVTVAVFGNSHAMELAHSLAELLRDRGVGIVHHTISGCDHNYKLSSEAETVCSRWHTTVFQEIVRDQSIEHVVLSYRNEWYLNNDGYRKSLVDLSRDLVASGKKVILVLQAPKPSASINQHLAAALPDLSGSIPGRTLNDWRDLYAASATLLTELPAEVSVVDPADLFCKNDFCYVSLNGVALFFDDNHMSLAGSKLVAERLVQLISQP